MAYLKRIVATLIVIVSILTLSACSSSNPCESCGRAPTKAYKNDYTGEKEYYCSNCSSDCAFCSERATTHYTSGLGIIVFVCKDCYQEIQDLNSRN